MGLPGLGQLGSTISSSTTGQYNAGQALGSGARGAVDLAAKSLAAIRKFGTKDYSGPNDGLKPPSVNSFDTLA